jgi:hypothetical protein
MTIFLFVPRPLTYFEMAPALRLLLWATADLTLSILGKLLLVFVSTVILGSRSLGSFRTHENVFRAPTSVGQVNCCWPSSAQSFLVLGPVMTRNRILCVLRSLRYFLLWEKGSDYYRQHGPYRKHRFQQLYCVRIPCRGTGPPVGPQVFIRLQAGLPYQMGSLVRCSKAAPS